MLDYVSTSYVTLEQLSGFRASVIAESHGNYGEISRVFDFLIFRNSHMSLQFRIRFYRRMIRIYLFLSSPVLSQSNTVCYSTLIVLLVQDLGFVFRKLSADSAKSYMI